MKDEEFKQKLSEVAEWRFVLPEEALKLTSAVKKRYYKPKRVKPVIIEPELDLDSEEEPLVVENTKPTIHLVKPKIQAVDCQDCGQHCEHGRRKEIHFYYKGQHKLIREKCITCQRHKDPYTNEFVLTPGKSNIVWHSYMKSVGGPRYQGNPNHYQFEDDGRLVEHIETDEDIIRKYLD
jgi:hypothetical protein